MEEERRGQRQPGLCQTEDRNLELCLHISRGRLVSKHMVHLLMSRVFVGTGLKLEKLGLKLVLCEGMLVLQMVAFLAVPQCQAL